MLPAIAGTQEPGSIKRTTIEVQDPDSQQTVAIPVLVARGAEDGPTLCLVSAQDGRALNGPAASHLLFRHLDLASLKGIVIAVPVANPLAARIGQAVYPVESTHDAECSTDLTCAWPGNPEGGLAERIATALWEHCVEFCHVLIDFHTHAPHYGMMTTVRTASDASVETARAFGVPHVRLMREAISGRLYDVAAREGKAALEVYLPPPRIVDPASVRTALRGLRNVMAHVRMVSREPTLSETALVMPETECQTWYAPTDAIVLAHVDPGSIVQEGKLVAELISLHDFQVAAEAVAPFRGVVTLIGRPGHGVGCFDRDTVTRGDLYARVARCDL